MKKKKILSKVFYVLLPFEGFFLPFFVFFFFQKRVQTMRLAMRTKKKKKKRQPNHSSLLYLIQLTFSSLIYFLVMAVFEQFQFPQQKTNKKQTKKQPDNSEILESAFRLAQRDAINSVTHYFDAFSPLPTHSITRDIFVTHLTRHMMQHFRF